MAEMSRKENQYYEFLRNVKKPNECAICLEPIGPSNTVTTPCNHEFHMTCLYNWCLQGNKKCPLCRAPIDIKCKHIINMRNILIPRSRAPEQQRERPGRK